MTLVLRAPQEVGETDEPRTEQPAEVERFPIVAVVVAAVISVALRARFITTPLTSDEGGYLTVARTWASGKQLYTDAWVDRPQGLLVLYRAWDDLTGGSAPAIRIMAIVFGVVAVVAIAHIGYAIAGPRAAAVGAVLVAIASSNARIEGFIANGELLAGSTGAAGVAMAGVYLFRDRSRSWLFAGGAIAGVAISLKQSGCDGMLAVLLCLAAGSITRERTWREVVHECAVYLAGVASILAVLVAHAMRVGFRAWWYAVAGYRLEGINGTSRADWHRFGITRRIAEPTILPLAFAASIGVVVWLVRSRRITRSTLLLPAWICFAIITFLAGGLFHRHYWVTLTFPLAAAAAVAVARVRARSLSLVIVFALVAPSLISTIQVVRLPRQAAALLASDDPRSAANERVGAWFRQHRTPGSTLYAMCASAGLYASADTTAPFPYLWEDGVLHGKGAQDDLVELFAGSAPPTFVVEYQSALDCNPSGQVETLLRQRYTQVAIVNGLTVLRSHTLRDVA